VEYSLTTKGEALVPLIEDMRRYGSEWLDVRECAPGEAATAGPVTAAA
jgi:DNA-binding HxlR family transcriptional regulator